MSRLRGFWNPKNDPNEQRRRDNAEAKTEKRIAKMSGAEGQVAKQTAKHMKSIKSG